MALGVDLDRRPLKLEVEGEEACQYEVQFPWSKNGGTGIGGNSPSGNSGKGCLSAG